MTRFRWLASLGAAGLMALACGGQLAGNNNTNGSGAPIKVDLIGSMSGLNADLGNWAWDGVKLAVDQANAKGGVSGRKINLQQLDDQGQPTVATDLAQRAISDHVVMVYGSNLSSV